MREYLGITACTDQRWGTQYHCTGKHGTCRGPATHPLPLPDVVIVGVQYDRQPQQQVTARQPAGQNEMPVPCQHNRQLVLKLCKQTY